MPSRSEIESSSMRLDQFLKVSGLVDSGGQAKVLIQGGDVLVNGDLETRRRRKLVAGDVVRLNETDYPLDPSLLGVDR